MKKNIVILCSLILVAVSVKSFASESKRLITNKDLKKEKGLIDLNEWKPKYLQKRAKAKKRVDVVKTKASSTKFNRKSLKRKIKPMSVTKPTTTTEGLSLEQKELFISFQKQYKKAALTKLRKKTLKMNKKAVPVLTKVMKDGAFPEKNRWLATFLLGRIMGKRSAPFISKFAKHPHWMMRLAALKVLLALDQKQYKGIFARALKDDALIVRVQAIDNINRMKLKELAPHIWGMLFDKTNYKGIQGKRKRTNIIKEVILSMGKLGFKKAKKPMLGMMSKKKYKDIHDVLDQSLSLLYKKKSPKGNLSVKQYFWSRQATKEKVI